MFSYQHGLILQAEVAREMEQLGFGVSDPIDPRVARFAQTISAGIIDSSMKEAVLDMKADSLFGGPMVIAEPYLERRERLGSGYRI